MKEYGTVHRRAQNYSPFLLSAFAALSIVAVSFVLAAPASPGLSLPASLPGADRPATPYEASTSSAFDLHPDSSAAVMAADVLVSSSSAAVEVADTAPSSAPSVPQAELRPAAATVPAPAAATSFIQLLDAGLWDAVSISNVQQALAVLPAPVQAQLGNPLYGSLKILVNPHGRTASGYQPYGKAANFFSTNEGTNEVVLYPQQSVFTILHELGHAYNLRRSTAGNYATVLIDPEMESFLAMSGWRVLTPPTQIATMYDHTQVDLLYTGAPIWGSMSRNDPLEDFANSFATYFLNPGDLASRSPERYAWFAARF